MLVAPEERPFLRHQGFAGGKATKKPLVELVAHMTENTERYTKMAQERIAALERAVKQSALPAINPIILELTREVCCVE